MLKARLVLIALLVGAIAPTSVSGQSAESAPRLDLIETLNNVCVASQGDASRAAELARTAGFSPAPQSLLPRLRNASQTSGFMRSTEADLGFVMTGRMSRRVGGKTVVMDFCGVSSRPTDHRALDDRLRQSMGFAPVRGAGFEAYAWLQTPEGRAPTRSLTDPQFLSMAATGQMRMVGLDRSGPGSTLIYFLPRVD